jgi:hypothetical protein
MSEDQARTASARVSATTQEVAGRAQRAADEMKKPENQDKAADTAAKSMWGTLAALLLSLGAAAFGGYLGSGGRREHGTHIEHDRTRVS